MRHHLVALARLSLALAWIAVTLTAPTPAAHAAPAAPAFYVTVIGSGQKFDSRSALGKKVLVVRFQASWCKVCEEEAVGFERLYRKYKEQGVEFIVLHIQETEAEARSFLEAQGATYPVGLDPRLAVANRFGFRGTPYTVIVDRGGEMVVRLHGRADEARLGRTLDAILASGSAAKAPPRRVR